MNATAAFHANVKSRIHLALIALLVGALVFVSFGGSASAAPPVGKDGKIHACYRVKGKPKGGLRVVPSAKVRCKRGERKVAWAVAGVTGQSGAAGAAGQSGGGGGAGQNGVNGQGGATGEQGTAGASLSTQVASLNVKVDGLEEVLDGVTHGDLVGALDVLDVATAPELDEALSTLNGITSLDLNETIDALPNVEALCDQTSTVTDGFDALRSGISGLSILGGGGLLSLDTSGLPGGLGSFTCPNP